MEDRDQAGAIAVNIVNLDLCRRAAGMTQRELADAARVSAGHMSRILAGRTGVSPDTMSRLLKAFGDRVLFAELCAPETSTGPTRRSG